MTEHEVGIGLEGHVRLKKYRSYYRLDLNIRTTVSPPSRVRGQSRGRTVADRW